MKTGSKKPNRLHDRPLQVYLDVGSMDRLAALKERTMVTRRLLRGEDEP